MLSSKLQKRYELLSHKDIQLLSAYLSSPFFQVRTNTKMLHKEIANALLKNKYKEVASVFLAIENKYTAKENNLSYTISDLINEIDSFFYYIKIKQNEPFKDRYVFQAYTEKQLPIDNSFLKTNSTKLKDTIKKQSAENYLNQHFQTEIEESLQSKTLKNYSKLIAKKSNSTATSIDYFYIVEKMKQICSTINDTNVLNSNKEVFSSQFVLATIKKTDLVKHPLINTYYTLYLLLTKQATSYYFQLKSELQKNQYEFESNTLIEFHTYARNFCIRKINAGNSEFLKELFDLYKLGLKQNAIIVNNEINERNFKNIVIIALRNNEIEWAKEFISDYQKYLPKHIRSNAINYNLAQCYFYEKNHNLALEKLNKVELNDIFYGLDGRMLLLKCYFEMNEELALLNAMQTFSQFVNRKKAVASTHQKNYSNFMKYLKYLFKNNSLQKLTVLYDKVSQSKNIADKNWLLQTIRQKINSK